MQGDCRLNTVLLLADLYYYLDKTEIMNLLWVKFISDFVECFSFTCTITLHTQSVIPKQAAGISENSTQNLLFIVAPI